MTVQLESAALLRSDGLLLIDRDVNTRKRASGGQLGIVVTVHPRLLVPGCYVAVVFEPEGREGHHGVPLELMQQGVAAGVWWGHFSYASVLIWRRQNQANRCYTHGPKGRLVVTVVQPETKYVSPPYSCRVSFHSATSIDKIRKQGPLIDDGTFLPLRHV